MMKNTAGVALLVVSSMLAGCAHAPLVAPPTDASGEELEAAWKRLRPSGLEELQQKQDSLTVAKWKDALVLGDGTKVTDPMALLPVVHPDSKTAQHARTWRDRNKPAQVFMGVTVGSLIGAIGLGSVDIALAVTGGRPQGAIAAAHATGYVICMSSAFLGAILGFLIIGNTEPERLQAFKAYPSDLHDFLFGAAWPEHVAPFP
jgi:hypothetical protein